jgi:hypothetical protein
MTRSEQDNVSTYLTYAHQYLDYVRKLKSLEDEPFMPEVADMMGKIDQMLVGIRAGFYTRDPIPPTTPAKGKTPPPSNGGRSQPYRLTKDSPAIRAEYMCIKCNRALKVGEWITHHNSIDGVHGYEDTCDTWHYPNCGPTAVSKRKVNEREEL